jgi:hypothetical protein
MMSVGDVAHMGQIEINAFYSPTNVEKCHFKKYA